MDLPRVTEILRAHTSYDQVPKDILERAAARGSSVHALCAGIAKGDWIPESMIAEELLGYVKSFRQWSDLQVRHFLVIERRYKDEVLGFSGQVDFVVQGVDGDLYLVDLKTSAKPQRTYTVQMAAYRRLLELSGIEVKGAMLVYLDKAGEFPDIDYNDDLKEELRVFFCALDCWKFFHKRKVNVKFDSVTGASHRTEYTSAHIECDERVGLYREGSQTSQWAIPVC